jgi:uncharacterized protein (DUF1697 family)
MEKLRGHFESLGLREVETFIASGNVIFVSNSANPTKLQQKIEDHLRVKLGYEVKTFIRTEPELLEIAKYKPFAEKEFTTALAVNVALLSEPLSGSAAKAVSTFATEIDQFHVNGREVYWLCRRKQSDSKFSNVRFEKLLNARATWRNTNTIARLATKYRLSLE